MTDTAEDPMISETLQNGTLCSIQIKLSESRDARRALVLMNGMPAQAETSL